MIERVARSVRWSLGLAVVTLAVTPLVRAAQSAGAQPAAVPIAPPAPAPASPSPAQQASEADHQRMMDLLHLTSLPHGPSSADPRTYDEATADPYPTLPDPLTMKNGKTVTTADQWWKTRRPEILEDFEREIYGRTPAHTPKVTWTVTSTTPGMNGDVPIITKTLVGHVDNSGDPALVVDLQALLSTPASATGPVPVILQFSGGGFGPFAPARPGSPDAPVGVTPSAPCMAPPAARAAGPAGPGALPAAGRGPAGVGAAGRAGFGAPTGPTWQQQILAKGWGYAQFNTGSVQGDCGAGLTAGIIGLTNKGQPRKLDDWGVLSAWAWGASRVLDYFETDKAVDAKHVGLEGHSRWGKATLLAMALDQRFAIGYVSSSGEGGAKINRHRFGETVDSVAATGEYHWMAGNFLKYAGHWNDMPVDSHELIALCAPRPIFISGGKGPDLNRDGSITLLPNGKVAVVNDAWADAKGMFLAAAGAGPVYRLLGKKDMGTTAFPPIETPLTNGEVAFRQHAGGHTDAPNWPTFLSFAARYFPASPMKTAMAR